MIEKEQETMKKMRELSIAGCEVIGEGAMGKVYRLDDETIIKVYAPGVPLEVVREEKNIAKAAFVAGVPTAISFDVVKVGESYGAVYEMLQAKTLSSYIMEHPEQTEEMGKRLGRLLKELHEIPADTNKFVNVCELYKERVHRMEKYLSKDETDKLLAVYDSLEESTALLHGDFHPKNIMYMNDELIFIDMADVGYGHPLLDIGGTYLVMVHFGKMTPERVPHYIGLDYETALKVWNSMLTEYFNAEDIEEAEILASIYGQAKHALFPAIIPNMDEGGTRWFISEARKHGFFSSKLDISPALKPSIKF